MNIDIFDLSRAVTMIVATVILGWVCSKRRDLFSWLYAYIATTLSQIFRVISIDPFDTFELISISFSTLSMVLIIIAVSVEYYKTFYRPDKKKIYNLALLALTAQIFTIGLELVIAFLVITTFFLIFRIYLRKKTPTHAFLCLVLISGLMNLLASMVNSEGSEGTEQFFQFSSDMMVITLLITGVVALIEDKLVKSEKGYRLAYNRAEFYKDLFVHDINNILQNLEFSLEIMSKELENKDITHKFRDLINLAKKQVDRGAELSVNVRRLSDLETGKNNFTSVNVFDLVSKIGKFILERFPDTNLNLNFDSIEKNLEVNANDTLDDVFRILLNNAIRYNDNSEIEVVITASTEPKNGVNYQRIEITDNGIGMPDPMKDSVFYKIYEKPKSYKRIGLGLLLVSEVIQSFNGKVWIEDKVKGDYKKGSRFVILLPSSS
ncbi:MAG: Signal transduction histidine kinase [Candidatus Lokiarchaeum sp. GC14_75]|nr:MAG: Signal transduction histidine kinase [Candidatus Lokiarchaeum sp. GC14_75]